jgi:formylglycine-generating enzyme required for sulfatase activity
MRRIVAFAIACLLATGVVLCLAGRAWADAAGDYQTLFGEEEKAVAAKGAKAAPEFAAKVLAAAKSAGGQKDLQVLLCEKAYEFGMKAPAGYGTAIDAMKLLIESAPDDKKAAAQDKLLAALQLRCTKSTGEERKRVGEELVDLLVAGGDARAEAKQPTEAIALYRRALAQATAGQSARTKEIMDKIKDLSATLESEKKLADLKARLEKNPADAAARTALILLYLGELDSPAETAKLLTADLDEGLRTYVPLAAKKVEDLEEATCLQLAEWYANLAEKASPAGKGILLGRAKGCCGRFLVLHTTQDAALLKGKMLLAKVDKAMEKAGAGQGKEITLTLGKGVTMKLVRIPPGKFMMGSTQTEKDRSTIEGPQHEVTISKPFFMGIYEVTQEQYEAVVGKNPSQFKGKQNPVEQVSWADATAFCRAMSAKTKRAVRLPTEAEWEYACRAGTKTRFCFGDDAAQLEEYGWHSGNSDGKTHEVGQKKPNALGLFDMYGNVHEWCSDWSLDSYANVKATDPQGPDSGAEHIMRGGCWRCPPHSCRSATRAWNSPPFRIPDGIGFRVVVVAGGAN